MEKFASSETILQKEYTIAPHMYDSAFGDYQKKFFYPTNYAITGVLLVLAIVFVILGVTKSAGLITLALICVVAIAFVWIKTINVRKKFVQNITNKVKDERQTAQFYEGGVMITVIPKGSTTGQRTTIDYSSKNIKVLNKKYYFLVCIAKSEFRIIPKKVFDASEEATLIKCFQKQLGSNYIG